MESTGLTSTSGCAENEDEVNGQCVCKNQNLVLNECKTSSEMLTYQANCLESGGWWDTANHNCDCTSSGDVGENLQQASSYLTCVCKPGYDRVTGENSCYRAISGAITLNSNRWTSNSASSAVQNASRSASPATVYSKYATGIYTDSGANNQISQLTTLPTMSGYIFGGFYTNKATSGSKVVDETGAFTASAKVQVNKIGNTATWYARWIEKTCGSNEEYNSSSGTCECVSGYYRLGDNCVTASELNQAAQTCFYTGGTWISATNICDCPSADHLQQHSSGLYCECMSGYSAGNTGNSVLSCVANPCGANQHQVQQGGTNVCVCDTGYEMVYGVSGSNYHAGLYCVLPQVNQSSSFASAAPDMCYVSCGVGSSIQNGCGFSEGQEYPDSSNWKLEWSNNVAFGEAVCVGTEASDVFGTMYSGFGGQGTSCVCRISGQPFYVLAGSVGSTVSDCQTYCPSMCGCQASGESHSGQCSAIDPGSFRARLYTAAP